MKIQKILVALLFCVVDACCVSESTNPTVVSQQMILALADDWPSTTGCLQRFERATGDDAWHAVGEKVAVSFGKNGLGWGIGLHDKALEAKVFFTEGPRVVEGSRRSPAGVFALSQAFGKTDKNDPEIKDIQLQYIQITPHVWGVDDVKSKYYNRIVDDQLVQKDWDSAEDMMRYASEGVYEFGVVIEHNYEHPIPGKGSCFFIHVHRTPGSPTWGCTAFAKDQVKEVMCWLDPNKKPVLVQLTVAIFNALKIEWNLPDFSV